MTEENESRLEALRSKRRRHNQVEDGLMLVLGVVAISFLVFVSLCLCPFTTCLTMNGR